MSSPSSPVPAAGDVADQVVGHVADLVARAAADRPDHPAIVDADTTLSWAEVDAAASAEAERLHRAGVRPGDRVVVRLPNGAAFCVAVLGALRAGAIAVPTGPVSVSRELEVVFGDCSPRVVVTTGSDPAVAALTDADPTGPGRTVLGPPDLGARPEGAAPDQGPGGEEIALLVYTSGTTGRPRGVCLSHRAVLANRAQAGALRPAPVNAVDRVLLVLPLFHVYGLAAGFLQVCWAGATVVLTDRFEPDGTVELVLRERVSVVAGVPSMFRAILDAPPERVREAFAGVRLCTSGGAPLPGRWLEMFRTATGLELFEGYGLSEAGPVLTTNQPAGRGKIGSVGRPLPGVELRLVDAQGRALDADPALEHDEDDFDPAQDTGLVAVRGPNLFSGYWPDRGGGPDEQGWFRTADVGFLDAEGDLHLVDRSSDLVIVNGFNVYPREVEQVLAELAAIAEAAVVGVPDDRSGEAVKAVLVRASGVELTADEVREHCATRLARFKVPSVIDFVDALPRTPTGKVARRQLVGGER